MDSKRLAIGTVVGGITVYALGYLIFELIFGSFYAANVGTATGVDRDPDLIWAVALGALAYAALITLGVAGRAVSVASGLKVGAVVGFLLWATADFTLYGITNLSNLTRTVVDTLLEGVRGGIAGAVIAMAIGKMK
jgi:hypothetical protein